MKDINQIIVVKPGTISAEHSKVLKAAGFIVIECENPSDFRVITFADMVKENEILHCAMKAILSDYQVYQKFGKEFAELLQKKSKPTNP
jgi:hypothetical protein